MDSRCSPHWTILVTFGLLYAVFAVDTSVNCSNYSNVSISNVPVETISGSIIQYVFSFKRQLEKAHTSTILFEADDLTKLFECLAVPGIDNYCTFDHIINSDTLFVATAVKSVTTGTTSGVSSDHITNYYCDMPDHFATVGMNTVRCKSLPANYTCLRDPNVCISMKLLSNNFKDRIVNTIWRPGNLMTFRYDPTFMMIDSCNETTLVVEPMSTEQMSTEPMSTKAGPTISTTSADSAGTGGTFTLIKKVAIGGTISLALALLLICIVFVAIVVRRRRKRNENSSSVTPGNKSTTPTPSVPQPTPSGYDYPEPTSVAHNEDENEHDMNMKTLEDDSHYENNEQWLRNQGYVEIVN